MAAEQTPPQSPPEALQYPITFKDKSALIDVAPFTTLSTLGLTGFTIVYGLKTAEGQFLPAAAAWVTTAVGAYLAYVCARLTYNLLHQQAVVYEDRIELTQGRQHIVVSLADVAAFRLGAAPLFWLDTWPRAIMVLKSKQAFRMPAPRSELMGTFTAVSSVKDQLAYLQATLDKYHSKTAGNISSAELKLAKQQVQAKSGATAALFSLVLVNGLLFRLFYYNNQSTTGGFDWRNYPLWSAYVLTVLLTGLLFTLDLRNRLKKAKLNQLDYQDSFRHTGLRKKLAIGGIVFLAFFLSQIDMALYSARSILAK